ncbi:hypothetical protein BGX29_010908 [Mortierella sp. GBA35]|nr:hypothetical protein BGX29_010908 [Mortierella sp. GBA35]
MDHDIFRRADFLAFKDNLFAAKSEDRQVQAAMTSLVAAETMREARRKQKHESERLSQKERYRNQAKQKMGHLDQGSVVRTAPASALLLMHSGNMAASPASASSPIPCLSSSLPSSMSVAMDIDSVDPIPIEAKLTSPTSCANGGSRLIVLLLLFLLHTGRFGFVSCISTPSYSSSYSNSQVHEKVDHLGFNWDDETEYKSYRTQEL